MNIDQWNLTKYAKWEHGDWKIINSEPLKELSLVLQDVQLMVLHGDSLLESVSLATGHSHLKCLYENCTLVFGVKHENTCRKFRILFSSHLEGERCVVGLRKYVDVKVSEGSRPVIDRRLEPVSVILPKILKNKTCDFPAPECIPEEYPLEAAVRSCILDPGFGSLVQRVHSIISPSTNNFNTKN